MRGTGSGFYGGWSGAGAGGSLVNMAGSISAGNRDDGFDGDTESCGASTQGEEEENDFPPSYAEAVNGSDHDEDVAGAAGAHGWGPETLV